MIKKIIFTLIIICSIGATAQETRTKKKAPKHEIKINTLYTIIGIPEIGYEYFLTNGTSIGVDILYSSEEDINLKFAITPHYRFYFGRKPITGFFTEIFGMLNKAEVEENYDYGAINNYTYKQYTDVALGFAVGAKFLTRKGWTFELSGGIGRNLISDKSVDFVPRGGISIGKRF